MTYAPLADDPHSENATDTVLYKPRSRGCKIPPWKRRSLKMGATSGRGQIM